MRRALLAVPLLVLVLAGCTSPAPAQRPPSDDQPAAFAAHVPWWEVGDTYTVRLERPGQPTTTWRMANFWNDTETAHFWLGVEDRNLAMDMALFDSNPFLGRIHHGILTPHEKGMHAAMYNFPLEDGKRWTGFFFGRNWSFLATEAVLDTPLGSDQGFRVEGDSADGDGARIVYDYSPQLRWFSDLKEYDRSGRVVLSAVVEQYERGVRGTYTFLRGRDFYKGPALTGTHDEPVQVAEEVDSLAFYVKARSAGPLEVQLLDPRGQVRYRESAALGNQISFLREVRPATLGEWKVRYVATGAIDGQVRVTGLLETGQSI